MRPNKLFEIACCNSLNTLVNSETNTTTIKMKHMAVYMMLVLGGNATPSKADIEKALSAVGIESDDTRLSALMKEMEGKDLNELVTAGKERLAKFGSGGGGGGGGGAGGAPAAEEEKVEEPEEEEAEIGGGMDMFGGDEGAGGDY
jgi:large subunit ribosomal protein LP2